MNGEKCYLDLLKDCIILGEQKENRTGVDTLVLPPQHFQHDMSEGFPLMTTKKVAKKSMLVELEGFIKGITDKTWFQERGCKFWNEWSNDESRLPTATAEEHTDLGPIYGYQWRRHGLPYTGPDNTGKPRMYTPMDQLSTIVTSLHENPNDRRMVCSAWNPAQHHQMALPPCHTLWNVQHINGTLNLHWHQRSCDMFLGVPINIASYAMLLTLLADEAKMEVGQLSATLCDCHVYVNHLDQIKEQTERTRRPLPKVELRHDTGIFGWTHKAVKWKGYDPHPPIKAPIAV